MNKLNLFTLLFISFFAPYSLMAQPIDEHQHVGCHHVKSKIPLRTLTAEEKEQMLQSQTRSDSIDLLNYAITLEIIDFTGRHIQGNCLIDFKLIEAASSEMILDLLELDIDSILLNGVVTDYNYDGNLITIDLPVDLDTENTYSLQVFYQGTPTVAASGFGGLAFDGGIAYNLGIGLGENPYNFGRSWFPCFDNFVERSTFDLNIITANGRKAYCSGHFIEEEALEGDTIRRYYRIDQPMTTYLVGVAVSNYFTVESTHTGVYGEYPIQLVAQGADLGAVDDSFQFLGDCIDIFESWYGPYRWGRVGFVMTPVGAMEHVHNIAYPRSVGVSGPTFGQNRLMAHELAHHWWGNVTTLSSAADMWIKEGNAEYGAHLFTEYVEGREEYIKQVKNNHLDVLRSAHVDDDGYQPLSGIPYEQTYGTHTYYKGASMMHNMRTYMGDSLFALAQSAVLEDFTYSAVDGEDYRDHLSLISGIDMNPFFDAWIFSPGYSNFEINDISFENMGSEYEATIDIQQKLRGAEEFHTAVPLSVTFMNEDWEEYTVPFMVSGEFSTVAVQVPFNPIMSVLNQDQGLNLARMNVQNVISETGNVSITGSGLFTLNAETVEDSSLINIVHHWTGADPSSFEGIEVSNTHYWTVKGDLTEGTTLEATFRFSPGSTSLDDELLENGPDFVQILYRTDPNEEWSVITDAEITTLGTGGFIRVSPFIPGEYTLANVYIDVPTQSVERIAEISISPNPSDQHMQVSITHPEAKDEYELFLYNSNGQLIRQATYPEAVQLQVDWPTRDLPNGLYILDIHNGNIRQAMEVAVQH
jgi:hypothetical protein